MGRYRLLSGSEGSKGYMAPIIQSGKYKGGNKNLMNITKIYLEQKDKNKKDLLKLGTEELLEYGADVTARSNRVERVGDVILREGNLRRERKRIIKVPRKKNKL